jgi:hypothetical protein
MKELSRVYDDTFHVLPLRPGVAGSSSLKGRHVHIKRIVDDDILNKVNLKSRRTMRNSVRDQCKMGKISQAGVSWNHRDSRYLNLESLRRVVTWVFCDTSDICIRM